MLYEVITVAGLTDVKKDADVKNSVIQLSVGIMF